MLILKVEEAGLQVCQFPLDCYWAGHMVLRCEHRVLLIFIRPATIDQQLDDLHFWVSFHLFYIIIYILIVSRNALFSFRGPVVLWEWVN
jgi:hypothetical protein